MAVKKLSCSLSVSIAALIAVPQAPAAEVPENDYRTLRPEIRKTSKDVSAMRAWFEKSLKPLADTDGMFTPECREYLGDVALFNWDGSVSLQQLRRKWGTRYDVGRAVSDHPFEDGNCGWESRKVAACEYLGELNGGDWFRLTIKGGCQKGDYSRSLQRVAKVVTRQGRFLVANLLQP